jgi:hypothetical protein
MQKKRERQYLKLPEQPYLRELAWKLERMGGGVTVKVHEAQTP